MTGGMCMNVYISSGTYISVGMTLDSDVCTRG